MEDLEDFSGPVLIKLGEPEGLDLPQASVPAEKPVPETPPEPSVAEAPEEAPVPEEAVVPERVAAVQPAKEKPAALPKPSESVTPAVEEAKTPETVPQPPRDPEPVMIKGSDAGNAYETVFATEEGNIGRNLWIPIYLYMPLPVI